MKILLINLKESCDEKLLVLRKHLGFSPSPLNLQILASLTPNEDVEIVDENFDEIDFDGDYDLVGLTGYGIAKIARAKGVYEEFKKRNVPVVIGGPSISCMPEKDALKYADSIVLGEGEGAWERVVRDAKKNKLKRAYQNKELVDLSKIKTLPRRDLTKNRDYMLHKIEISRGCPHNCDYCLIPKLYRGKYRRYSINRIVKEVEQCLEYPTKTRRIYFVDSNISAKPDYNIKLFKKIIPYNIVWWSQSDISIAKNKKLLDVLAKSGCSHIDIGFESINQESLNSVNKPTINKVSEYKKAIKILHDYGITVVGCFMLGLDGDKPGVAKKTLDFVSDTKIDFIPFITTPVYGTRLFERLEKDGRILTKDQSKYDAEHVVFQPKNMTPEQLEEEYRWLIKHSRFPIYRNLIQKILMKRSVLNKDIKFTAKLSTFLCYMRAMLELIKLKIACRSL